MLNHDLRLNENKGIQPSKSSQPPLITLMNNRRPSARTAFTRVKASIMQKLPFDSSKVQTASSSRLRADRSYDSSYTVALGPTSGMARPSSPLLIPLAISPPQATSTIIPIIKAIILFTLGSWQRAWGESNTRPTVSKTAALSTELQALKCYCTSITFSKTVILGILKLDHLCESIPLLIVGQLARVWPSRDALYRGYGGHSAS